MTSVILANLLLALPFLAAFTGIPLWITFRHPESPPDFTEAREYLAAKAAAAPPPEGAAAVSSPTAVGVRAPGFPARPAGSVARSAGPAGRSPVLAGRHR